MKQVRYDVDTAYRAIVDRINALIVINGESAYKNFVIEMNLRISKYKNLIAQRKGRNSKEDTFETINTSVS